MNRIYSSTQSLSTQGALSRAVLAVLVGWVGFCCCGCCHAPPSAAPLASDAGFHLPLARSRFHAAPTRDVFAPWAAPPEEPPPVYARPAPLPPLLAPRAESEPMEARPTEEIPPPEGTPSP